MISINIRHNFPSVAKAMNELPEKVGNQAMVRALNRTVEAGKVDMARAISREYVISVGEAKDRLEVRRASAKGGTLHFEAFLEATNRGTGRSMNVVAFLEAKVTLAEARRRAKSGTLNQLRFKFRREGGMKTIQGAFIGNKGRTVFRRTGKTRLPIEPVNTIGIPSMFQARKLNDAVRRAMMVKFRGIFEREVRYHLDKWRGG